jgi:hypothetical protein
MQGRRLDTIGLTRRTHEREEQERRPPPTVLALHVGLAAGGARAARWDGSRKSAPGGPLSSGASAFPKAGRPSPFFGPFLIFAKSIHISTLFRGLGSPSGGRHEQSRQGRPRTVAKTETEPTKHARATVATPAAIPRTSDRSRGRPPVRACVVDAKEPSHFLVVRWSAPPERAREGTARGSACLRMLASEELAEPDDAPIAPGSRRRRPRRIAAAEDDSDGEGAVNPAADEIANSCASEFMRLATTCSADGTPTGPWHGGVDCASRPWHGGGDLAGAEAGAESEPDPAQIEVHELKIAPQLQHVRECLRAGRRESARTKAATTDPALPGPPTRQSYPRRPQARLALGVPLLR